MDKVVARWRSRGRSGLWILLLCSLFAAATEQSRAADASSGTLVPVSVVAGGLERSLSFYVPVKLGGDAPLLLALHPAGGSGAEMRAATGREFETLADQQGFVVAYPDGIDGNWNDCRKAADYPARALNVDDEGFVAAIVARAVRDLAIDPRRVFAVGYSNGAQMAYRLALARPDLVAGIAAVAAGLPAPENLDCKPAGRPVPVMIINGTADPINPFKGGLVTLGPSLNFGTVIATEATARYFARLNGDGDEPAVSTLPHLDPADPTKVRRMAWSAPDKAPVVLYVVDGGGHIFPQRRVRFPASLGRQTGDLDAPVTIWDFFAALSGHAAAAGDQR